MSSTMQSSIQPALTPLASGAGLSAPSRVTTSSASPWPRPSQAGSTLMAQARPAAVMESTAPNLAWPWRPGSAKASLATKRATVRPTPPTADIAKRSTTVTPAGSPKPRRTASRPKRAMPRVLPMRRATRTAAVMPPTLFSFTPAFARPKKSMPRSTGSFIECSKTCSGASSAWCRASILAASSAVEFLRSAGTFRTSAAWATACSASLRGPRSQAPRSRTPSCAAAAWLAGMKGTTNTRARAGCTCAFSRPSHATGPARMMYTCQHGTLHRRRP
mmetsp:Transcript_14396/g.45334  ORF Transcript_14396/g.45334 Transcript_14396/m.45334 type:complete len:275 (-) Transcript_14396:217-1041(-)